MLNYYQNITIKYSQSFTGKTCSPLLSYRKAYRTNSCGNAIANSLGLLHAESGFSYFGARYYDSDLMTGWLSVDPMADKYPSLSPYAYCAWNPIKFIDPNGEFKIPIHVEIVSGVIGDNIGCVKTALIKYGTGIYADIFGYFSEKIHLDNIGENKGLFDQYATLLSKFNSKYWNPISMGKDLHTIADFYAHSNYIGLYMKYVGNNPGKNFITVR